METHLVYLLGTLLAVDVIVLTAWAVPCTAGTKIGYRWRKILWMILAVRLLVPVRLLLGEIYGQQPSHFLQVHLPMSDETMRDNGDEEKLDSMESAMEQNAGRNVNENAIQGNAKKTEVSPEENAAYAQETGNVPNGAEVSRTVVKTGASAVTEIWTGFLQKLYHAKWLLLALWISGALIRTEYHVIGFLNVRERLRLNSRHCTEQRLCARLAAVCEEYGIRSVPPIRICDNLGSPMLLGYRHTLLLMPDIPYTEAELDMIFRHEMQHLKNGDLWYKLLMMLVCDLYWFNPGMWLMEKLAYQDVECVCDTQVMCRLTPAQRKVYGTVVLSHMAKKRVRDIVYGTSIFTGKRAARRRIQNMFAAKNRWGYLVMGALVFGAMAGSSMWVLSGQENSGKDGRGTVQSEKPSAQPQESMEGHAQPEEELPTFYVDDMDAVFVKDPFDLADYYITNRVIVDNRYFIDENKVLWGYGKNEYGQLGMEDVSVENFYLEPVKIAEHVVTVDCSGNGYFCVYLTEDGSLYGLGSNMLGLLGAEQDGEILYYKPVTEPALLMENVVYARAGRECIAALDRDGNVWWWGQFCGAYHTTICDDNDYQKGVEDDRNPAKMLYVRPRKILENCIYATTGSMTGAAISADGSLYTWGRNLFGECGTPVTGDDFVRMPKKVLEDVRMVWVEKIAGNSSLQEIPRMGRYDTSYHFNLFARLTDGTMVGVGKDLGDKEKEIRVTGDLVQTSTGMYSDTFVPIALEEYDERRLRERLNGLAWGMDASRVREFLTKNRIRYFEVYEEYSNTQDHTPTWENYVIVAEDNRYRLEFDEKGGLDEIFIQEGGGSRNNRFMVGMSMEEIRSQFASDFTYEAREWNGIYWANELLDGNRYGFVFADGALDAVYERAG